MLVLLSFGLVLVATVLLVLGLLVDSGLSLIYGSIALSVIAAVVLFVAVRVSKPKEALASAPAPLLPEVIEIQSSLLTAVHAQSLDVVTSTLSLPPAAVKDRLLSVIAKVH